MTNPRLRRGLLHESNRRTDVLEKAVSAFVAAYALGDGVLLLRRPIGELLAERMNLMHNELQEQVKKNRFTLKLRAQFTVARLGGLHMCVPFIQDLENKLSTSRDINDVFMFRASFQSSTPTRH